MTNHLETSATAYTFTAPRAEWGKAIIFFLAFALLGLSFYPALLLVVVILMQRWSSNRYDFIVELTLFIGGFGFMHPNVLPVKMADVGLALGVVSIFICRKSPMAKKLLRLMLLYVALVVMIASTSDEPMRVQFIMMRNYFYVFYFFVPFAVFANQPFSFDKLLHSITVHTLVICGLYAADTYLLNALCLVPAAGHYLDPNFGTTYYSSVHRIIGTFNPLSLRWPRHYPYGVYWLLWLIIPIRSKQVRFSPGQWLLIALAVLSTRTATFMFGLVACYVCFSGNLKRVLRYAGIALVVLTGVYFADRATGGYVRLASTVDQFFSLNQAMDDEDVAEFASGRMAQILPKWELLTDLNRQWLGFGFLHPELTTNPKYQIANEYYIDVAKSDEVATAVEETHVQTILDIGFLGLILQAAIFIAFYYALRRHRHARYYLCMLIGFSLFGFGGFAGLITRESLTMIGLAMAAIVLAEDKAEQRTALEDTTPEYLPIANHSANTQNFIP